MGLWKRELGQAGEDLAARFLKQQGFSILERNVRSRFGEIDLVALKKREIYIVEVKTRSSDDYGEPIESVPWHRLRRLKKMAEWYLQRRKASNAMAHLSLLGVDHSQTPPAITFLPDILE